MVSEAKFIKDVTAIYAAGNMKDAYATLQWVLENTEDGQKENFYEEILLVKFREHVDAWKRKYGDRDEKYIPESANKELKNIKDFMGGYMWRHEFKGLAQSKSRDKYLFPNKSTEELIQSLHNFKQSIYATKKE